jgi:hypothetical protein
MGGRRSVLVGVFRDPKQARDAIGAIRNAGFRTDDIGLLLWGRVDALAMAADTGAGREAALGAVARGLTGLGVPKEEARFYEEEASGGRTLLTMRAGGRHAEARDILRRYGAYDAESRDRTVTTGETMVDAPSAEPGAHGRTPDATGGRSEVNESRCRYGWELRSGPEYRDRVWAEVERDFRRDWERRHQGQPWEEVRDTVREAWEQATEPIRRPEPSGRGGSG